MMARFTIICVLVLGLINHAQANSRIKDITDLEGLRSNQLIGYGLVVGLSGTGDSLRNAPFTDQAVKSMLDNLGVNVRDADLRMQNIAAVIVTADAPAFIQPGSRMDVTVSSLGDATSLRGGTLVMTALLGADTQIYAAAQGQLVVSGFAAQGDAQALTEGVPTVARVPNGAIIERPMPGSLEGLSSLTLNLANPDFLTATKAAHAINAFASATYGKAVATARDHRAIALKKPKNISTAQFLADIGEVTVIPDIPARVVMDERTGTVVIGENVRVSKIAITHGNISIRVSEMPEIIQPDPFSLGETATQPFTDIAVAQDGDQLAIVAGTSLETLVSSLNQLGVKPKGIMAILQAIKSAGALQAELVIQ